MSLTVNEKQAIIDHDDALLRDVATVITPKRNQTNMKDFISQTCGDDDDLSDAIVMASALADKGKGVHRIAKVLQYEFDNVVIVKHELDVVGYRGIDVVTGRNDDKAFLVRYTIKGMHVFKQVVYQLVPTMDTVENVADAVDETETLPPLRQVMEELLSRYGMVLTPKVNKIIDRLVKINNGQDEAAAPYKMYYIDMPSVSMRTGVISQYSGIMFLQSLEEVRDAMSAVKSSDPKYSERLAAFWSAAERDQERDMEHKAETAEIMDHVK